MRRIFSAVQILLVCFDNNFVLFVPLVVIVDFLFAVLVVLLLALFLRVLQVFVDVFVGVDRALVTVQVGVAVLQVVVLVALLVELVLLLVAHLLWRFIVALLLGGSRLLNRLLLLLRDGYFWFGFNCFFAPKNLRPH